MGLQIYKNCTDILLKSSSSSGEIVFKCFSCDKIQTTPIILASWHPSVTTYFCPNTTVWHVCDVLQLVSHWWMKIHTYTHRLWNVGDMYIFFIGLAGESVESQLMLLVLTINPYNQTSKSVPQQDEQAKCTLPLVYCFIMARHRLKHVTIHCVPFGTF